MKNDTEQFKHAYSQKLTVSDIDRRAILKSSGALLGGVALTGCMGRRGTDNSGGNNGRGANTTNVAIISSSAGFGDRAFNDLALKGLENAKQQFGSVKIQQVEETNPSKYRSVQMQLAQSKNPDYDLIVLVGYQHTKALRSNAKQYPDQRWMLINDSIDTPNVAGYIWANHQMSFQAGVLGGTMTTRDFAYKGSTTIPNKPIIGFVGGKDGALINAFERGYKAGTRYIDENVTVKTGYIGNYSDVQKANNIASSQYDAGADIVYHAAAAAGKGVFQAAQNANRFAIGVDADQSKTLPKYKDVIMGSAVKRINKGTYRVTKAIIDDNWESVNGRNVLGLEQDAVEMVLGQAIGPNLPEVVEQNLTQSKQAIVNGDVTVPCSASGCKK